MPLIFNRAIDRSTRLGLWKIEEEETPLKKQAGLDSSEERQFASFKNEVRKKQWLSYRALLRQILAPYRGTLEYDSFGKPRLRNSKLNISVAHSGDYAAVIISKNSAVGIDIERLKDRIYRIKDRFLTAEEDKNLGEINRLEKLYVAWGTKEALYKLYGKPEVEFQRDIMIESFDYLCTGIGQCVASMSTPETHEKYDVFYERISDYMLVYTLKKNAGNEKRHL